MQSRQNRICCLLQTLALVFSAVGADDSALERFYRENDGKSIRRLPSWVVPQVLFATISNVELAKSGEHTPSRIFDLVRNRIDVNVFAYSPRCTLELDSPEIEKRVKAAAGALWNSGADVLVHIDPRLMRDAFFAKWPEDCLHVRRFDVAKPDGDGVARFGADIDKMGDHTLYGTKRKFSWTKPGSLVSVRAVKDGDPATARTLAAEDVVCSTNLVSGLVRGLASNEVLVAEADFPLDEVDPCSPHLVPFAREMALRYKKLGAKGHYVDEWGFQRPSAAMREHRAFWHSKHFAERYAKASGGRDLAKDMLPFVLGIDTPEYRSAANAYIRAIYDTCKETEEAFYASVKELFGPDVYVGKHASWWSDLGCWKEFFHDGLDWWVAKRDWAVSDENVPVCADTGMMKKFGSPLWLNECYGTNPRHYVRTLWRFALCGGRMSWHGITGDKKADYLQRNYDKYSERRYHRIADMFSEDAVRAEQILRLLPLVTRSPIDCPVAYIFGHERLVNWLDSGFEDWGRELVDGLAVRGYYADAYPASEIAGGTFSVKDGSLWVGKQRYSAVVLYNLSEAEMKAWENMVGSRVPRDRFGHAGRVPLPTFAGHAGRVSLPTFENPEVAEVAAYLDSIKAVKQTPFPAPRDGKIPLMRLPPSDGVMRLIDGTAVRVKGGKPDFAGDRIEGELESGGVRAKYSARGMFAFRAENGEVTAIAGGEVTRIEAPGISLSLDTPADIALVKLADGWHGTWQTSADLAPIPPELKKLAPKWVRLHGGFQSQRPYELDWANRNADDRPVTIPLTSADGWTCSATNAEATVSTACERILFGDGVVHLAYRLDVKGGSVRIAPSAPVPLPPGFDTVSVWLYGNHTCFYRNGQARPILSAQFNDAEGRPFSIDLHVFNHSEWFLVQKRLPENLVARVAKGGTFTGFTLRGKNDDKKRWIELTSFAAFKEELKPLSFKPRRKRGVQIFPDEPQGLNTGEGRLPFPNVETTIIPIVAEDPDIEFKLPEDPTKWDDLAIRWRGHAGRVPLPASKSKVGSRVPRDRNATGIGCEDGWFYFAKGGGLFPTVAAKGAKVRFNRIANSLVADIEAPAGVEEVLFGRLESTNGAQFVPLPYYTCGGNGDGIYRRPCVVMAGEDDNRFFFLASTDWTQSNASWMIAPNYPPTRPPVSSNGGVRYYPKTDGARNPVFERFVWSFSRTFDDVMPVIPNPPSPYRAVTAERQWRVMYSSDREKNKAWWRNRHRRGIRHLIVNDHEVCMRDGNESFTFRTRPAPKKGGDEGMRDFTRFMIDELGYMYGPYNNYTDFAPVNGWWSVDRVARARDGNLQRAWNRCYAPKPAFVNEACEVIWTELQRKFGFNTAYCDVHTCTTPWQRTDYDARVPGAGTFAATFYSYGEILDFERHVLGGPVYSEGQSHFMYCGLVDGNYGQDQKARLPVEPWLVDFDLRRMHPLSNNFGMGSPQMFYEQGGAPTNAVERRDRFLAATVAFGHQGFFLTDSAENEEQSYFMLLGTGRHYCKANAKEIRYADGAGNLLDTSAAIASGAFRRSQVTVLYDDGTRTAANGSTNEEMTVEWNGGNLVLSPNGYCAMAGDGSAWVVSGAKRDDGGRLDVAVAPDYVYLNAYGKFSMSPQGGTDGRMYRLIGKDGVEEVFPVKGKEFILPYAAASVTALDEDGNAIGAAEFHVDNGYTRLMPRKDAMSYRVRIDLLQNLRRHLGGAW